MLHKFCLQNRDFNRREILRFDASKLPFYYFWHDRNSVRGFSWRKHFLPNALMSIPKLTSRKCFVSRGKFDSSLIKSGITLKARLPQSQSQMPILSSHNFYDLDHTLLASKTPIRSHVPLFRFARNLVGTDYDEKHLIIPMH